MTLVLLLRGNGDGDSTTTNGCLCFSVDLSQSLGFTITTCSCVVGNRMKQIYVDSDTDINVTDLTDDSTGDAVTDATVTWQLVDKYGDAVTSATGSCSHVSGGNYLGCVPNTISLTAGEYYTLIVTITNGEHDAESRTPVIACYKT